jgi:mannose-6-phosphate isomerase
MWYVVDSEPGAKLISGFNREVDKEKYLKHFESNTLAEILNVEEVEPGDVFYMPAGRVHAIGRGVVIAEIQQTSDVTYRIYDYNRTETDGKPRELHTDLALDSIDYSYEKDYRTKYSVTENISSEIVSCPYFTTNILNLTHSVEKDYNDLDSFVIYMCMDGNYVISWEDDKATEVKKGETILVPASIENYVLIPKGGSAKLLEVYIK